jgi:hypothetical protein
LRGAFSAATKLLARELTSTPDPEPKALIRPAAAVLAAALPVGVPLAAVTTALEEVEFVAVTMIFCSYALFNKVEQIQLADLGKASLRSFQAQHLLVHFGNGASVVQVFNGRQSGLKVERGVFNHSSLLVYHIQIGTHFCLRQAHALLQGV